MAEVLAASGLLERPPSIWCRQVTTIAAMVETEDCAVPGMANGVPTFGPSSSCGG